MCKIRLIALMFTVISCFSTECSAADQKKPNLSNTVKMWGEKLGEALRSLAETVTRKSTVAESFKQTKLVYDDGKRLTEEIADLLRVMMATKEQAVKNIVEKAENLSLRRKKNIFDNSTFDFYNANNITNTTADPILERQLEIDRMRRDRQFKCEEFNALNDDPDTKDVDEASLGCIDIPYIEHTKEAYYQHLPLVYHPHFDEAVNLNYSVLRIATSIFDREEPVLNDVRWSEALDLVFQENYKNDPTLTWQYFAGTTGFMRQYPAMQWSEEKYDMTFDFRTRAWYLEAVSSPKDVIILLDMSGSMWQYKWITAKSLVNYILDTLGDNDYVNVYLFNNDTRPLVDCFDYTLMQAHEENLRLLRESLDSYTPYYYGNMVSAFQRAFTTLERYRHVRGKAHCNQIIMLISEGIDYDYQATELFQIYNRTEPYFTPVRVFTFLIIDKISSATDEKEMEWIACANMGYYVNITRTSDIVEKVLKYLTVLSRPLNLHSEIKPEPIYTGTYVDLADRRLSNWLWNKLEGNRQRQVFVDYTREAYKQYNCIFEENDTYHFLLRDDHDYAKYLKKSEFKYMTTVSLPVYDKRPGETAVLGVVGVDIPIEYIKTLTLPHKIGVNGYAFILTNNGLVVLHPDHRKEFENIIKPTFNRVDMTEVELIDDENDPRDFNKSLLEMRDAIVNQSTNHGVFSVKTHIDDMKRVILSKRHYYFTNIGPFSLVVAIPDKYGFYQIKYEGTKPNAPPSMKHLNSLTKTKNWRIHPEWRYCKHYGKERLSFKGPEEELLYFLKGLKQPGWKWNKYCFSDLVHTLLLDASVTEWFENNYTDGNFDLNNVMNNFQVTIAFLATHTGLTRWKSGTDRDPEPNFIKTNNKAIDEVWYKRAVEYNYKHPKAFVYSVPFDNSKTLVTAASAIYRESGQHRSPVAVVGFQFERVQLHSIFTQITTQCDTENCHTCDSKELSCFVLDNDGYILVSKEMQHIGQFFGTIRPDIMRLMVENDGIYRQIRIFDYQDICYEDPPEPKSHRSPAHKSYSFYGNLFGIINWVYTSIVWFIKSTMGAAPKINPCSKAITEEYDKREIKKSLPTPCDRQMWLYTLVHDNFSSSNFNDYTMPNCLWYYIVRPISDSNLILVVVNAACSAHTVRNYPYFPVELEYNMTMPCYIATKNNYTRRSYIACVNKHEKENMLNVKDKKYCGVTWPT